MTATAANATAFDILIVGGGLAGCLTALRLKESHPRSRILIVESANAIGGDHTWSFHETDLAAEELRWIEPLLAGRWDGHTVNFSGTERVFGTRYFSMRSDELRARTESVLGAESIRVGTRVTSVSEEEIALENGERLRARCVLDARGGPGRTRIHGVRQLGYQKFVGLNVKLAAPHGLKRPRLMDARCEQLDGFRFFYVLPWSPTELLVEDTRYSDSPALEEGAFVREIEAYAWAEGWRIGDVTRRERGVLPIPLNFESQWEGPAFGAPILGTRAGFYHATTGYSLPAAVRIAHVLAHEHPLTPARARQALSSQARRLERDSSFLRLLNRMLFRAAAPSGRRRVMEKFYRLPEPLISRFYASAGIPAGDKLRILSGRPPVPILKALQCAMEGS